MTKSKKDKANSAAATAVQDFPPTAGGTDDQPTAENDAPKQPAAGEVPNSSGVLYVYRCDCGHSGRVYHADDSHDGENEICEACGEGVQVEWDGGVTLSESRDVVTGKEVLAAIDTAQQQIEKRIGETISQVVQRIPLTEIMPSPTNPRKYIDQAEIEALAENIRQQGLMQPIIVRPLRSLVNPDAALNFGPASREKCDDHIQACGPTFQWQVNDDCGYEIIAGERRYRAHDRLNYLDATNEATGKWSAIDCIVRDLTDHQVLEQQVSENLQREDLTPLDWSNAYSAMVIAERKSQPAGTAAVLGERGAVARVAERLGKSTSVVYQTMQLAKLIPEAATALRKEFITKNHAIDCARLEPEEQISYLCTAFEEWGTPEDMRELVEGDGPTTCNSVREMRAWIKNNYGDDESETAKPSDEQLPLAIGEDAIEEAAGMRTGESDDTPARRTPGGTAIPKESVFSRGNRVRDKKTGRLGTIESVTWLGADGYSGYHDVECDDGTMLRERPFDELEPAPKSSSQAAPIPTKSLQQSLDEADALRKERETEQKIIREGLKKILTASHSAAKRHKQLLTAGDLRRVADAMFFSLNSDQQEEISKLLRWNMQSYQPMLTNYQRNLTQIPEVALPQFLLICALAPDLLIETVAARSASYRSFESTYGVSLSAIRAELANEGKPKPAAPKKLKKNKLPPVKAIAKKPAVKKSVSSETFRTREAITKASTAKKPAKPVAKAKPAAKAKKAGRK